MATNNQWTLSYLLTDHLGSVVAVTDGTGALISQQRYLPFGGERTNIGQISQTDYGYTGQRDLEMGLMDYKARFYSSYLNQFTQPDTIVPDLNNPQDWNRYAYARNNPIRYNDPTGHCYADSGAWIPNGAGGACNFNTTPIDSGNNNSDDDNNTGDIADDLPRHDYSTVSPVCLNLPWINCTDTEVKDYMSRFQFPGQLFWQPVHHNTHGNVFPEKIGNFPFFGLLWPGSGAVVVNFSGNTISNVALPSHIFYEGRVDRTSYRDANGNPYVMTHGTGTNDGYNFIDTHVGNNRFALGVSGTAIDTINNNVGPGAFYSLDFTLIVYTTIVETGQYASSLLP